MRDDTQIRYEQRGEKDKDGLEMCFGGRIDSTR